VKWFQVFLDFRAQGCGTSALEMGSGKWLQALRRSVIAQKNFHFENLRIWGPKTSKCEMVSSFWILGSILDEKNARSKTEGLVKTSIWYAVFWQKIALPTMSQK